LRAGVHGMPRKRFKGWIYKCSLRGPDRVWSWVDPSFGDWLHEEDGVMHEHGGEEWIRSPHSWGYLAQAEKGDLVFADQSDLSGLVGLTIGASGGYSDPDGFRDDICTMISVGPERIAFEKIVTVRMIRRITDGISMEAYTNPTQLHTFHPVEDEVLLPL